MAFHRGDTDYEPQPGDKVWGGDEVEPEGVVLSEEEFEALTAEELRGAIRGWNLSVMRTTGDVLAAGHPFQAIWNGFYEFENESEDEEKAA